MAKRPKAPIGASLVVLSSLFYASYGIWTTLMGDSFEGYTASAIRSALVVLLLLLPALLYHKIEPLRLALNWKPIAGIFIGSLFTWGPLYYSIQHAGVGMSLTVNYASMVIGLFFFGWLMAKERFTKDKAVSGVLGIIGMLFIFIPSGSIGTSSALLLAVLSGISIGFTIVCVKKLTYNATQSTLVLWGISTLANIPMAFLFAKNWPVVSLQIEWLYLLLFAIASIVASWSLIKGLQYIDAGAAGVLGLLEIVFSVLFGIFLFNEALNMATLLGVVTIIIAAAIPYIKDYNSQSGTLQ
ncbi:MAG: DMT family transporter [Candidatus Saccharimonadales bacterium]